MRPSLKTEVSGVVVPNPSKLDAAHLANLKDRSWRNARRMMPHPARLRKHCNTLHPQRLAAVATAHSRRSTADIEGCIKGVSGNLRAVLSTAHPGSAPSPKGATRHIRRCKERSERSLVDVCHVLVSGCQTVRIRLQRPWKVIESMQIAKVVT